MKEYKILRSFRMEDMIDEVNRHLAAGWRLEGGVSVGIFETNTSCFYQAMSKESK